MPTISERIASELEKENTKNIRNNCYFIMDNREEIAEALHKYSKKILWHLLVSENKIDCKYISFCQLINKILPQFHRKNMSGNFPDEPYVKIKKKI